MDYYYYSNFHLLFNNIEDYNNKYLKTFMTENNFDKKTKCIFDFLTLKDEKPKTKCIFAKLSNILEIGEGGIFQNFGNFSALVYSSLDKKIQLYIKSKDKGIYEYINDIDFDKKISSFNFSADKTKIYVCLSDKKSINIINYNPKNNTLELSNEKIELVSEGQFNKCIYINSNCIIASDNNIIYLWSKNYLNKYINIKKLTFEYKIYDICQVDNIYLLLSQNQELKFVNIENFSVIKGINNIDCAEVDNGLIRIKDFTLVNCINGIAILSVKNKEMIQYIENFDFYSRNKKIFKSSDDIIYILNSQGDINKFYFYENNLTAFENIKLDKMGLIISSRYPKIDYKKSKLFLDNDSIFLWNDIIYSLEINEEN